MTARREPNDRATGRGATLLKRVLGADVDRDMRPLALTATLGLGSTAVIWSFVGIYAVDELEVDGRALGLTFVASAILAAAGAQVGGRLSDRLGRRPVISIGWVGLTFNEALLIYAHSNHAFALPLLATISLFGMIGAAAAMALVADVAPADRREMSYATVRVGANLGAALGPPAGALLLLAGGWVALFGGGAALALATAIISRVSLPNPAPIRPLAATTAPRGPFHDRLFVSFFALGCLAFSLYFTYETILPISLVDSHGMSPATWGAIAMLNPLAVTLFQLRIAARVRDIGLGSKLVAAVLMMGLPFLPLTVSPALWLVVAGILVFVIGEMLWAPAAQTAIADFAPAESRGAYIGAYQGTNSIGFALGPFLGLQVRESAGDAVMWLAVAAVAVVAAVLAAIVASSLSRRTSIEPGEVAIAPGNPVQDNRAATVKSGRMEANKPLSRSRR